jgi:hypothetical protein
MRFAMGFQYFKCVMRFYFGYIAEDMLYFLCSSFIHFYLNLDIIYPVVYIIYRQPMGWKCMTICNLDKCRIPICARLSVFYANGVLYNAISSIDVIVLFVFNGINLHIFICIEHILLYSIYYSIHLSIRLLS